MEDFRFSLIDESIVQSDYLHLEQGDGVFFQDHFETGLQFRGQRKLVVSLSS